MISVNDNVPQFISNNYTMFIPEDTPVGTSFMQIEALDADSGNNGFVDYVFSEQNDPESVSSFKLDMSSGTLRVDKKLDRERFERFLYLPSILQIYTFKFRDYFCFY